MQKKYIVDGNLKDDNGTHTTGDILVMEEEQAAPLVAIGRLKPAVEDITPPADKQPDGFPDRSLDNKEVENPPAAPQALPVNTEINHPANDGQSNEAANQPALPQKAPADPTTEQVAKDMEQLG